jgi:hypothetical protein
MPTFNLACRITVSASTEVEAETLADAITEANNRDVVLHFNGSGTDPTEVWCIEEADGEPEDIQEA